MNLYCRWGMHRPGPTKIANQGKHFTRCSDCGTTLYAIVRTWRRVPADKRVVWRPRTSKDIFFDVTINNHRSRLRFDPLAPFRRRAREAASDLDHKA